VSRCLLRAGGAKSGGDGIVPQTGGDHQGRRAGSRAEVGIGARREKEANDLKIPGGAGDMERGRVVDTVNLEVRVRACLEQGVHDSGVPFGARGIERGGSSLRDLDVWIGARPQQSDNGLPVGPSTRRRDLGSPPRAAL